MAAAGNGLHLHLSTRNASTNTPDLCDGKNLTSRNGGPFVEAILDHLPGLMGLTLPTVNSFRRIGPGCWTGSTVGWAVEDKECGVRVCSNLMTRELDHVEVKMIDHTCNIYLSLAGILFVGLNGIEKQLKLREPIEESIEPNPTPLPASLTEALDALDSDDLLSSLLGPALAKSYLALRRHEEERASRMTFDEEVMEFRRRA